MATKRTAVEPTIESQAVQAQILGQLTELRSKVDESLGMTRDNGNELKMLRRELGLDGAHGRLPIVEATLLRHEQIMENVNTRVKKLEEGDSESKGKEKLISVVIGLAGGGGGGALVALIAHLLR